MPYRVAVILPLDEAPPAHLAALIEAGQGLCAFDTLAPGALVEGALYDFVLCLSPALRKLTSHPTFLWARGAAESYLASDETLNRIRSFDGFLAASAELAGLFDQLLAGLERPFAPASVLQFTPAESTGAGAPVPGSVVVACRTGDAAVQWRPLIEALSTKPWARMAGPPAAWARPENPHPAPVAPGRKDAIALVLPSAEDEHQIPMDFFEAVAAGRPVIVPGLPELRRAFDGTVWFYDADASADTVLATVEAALAEISADPTGGLARVEAAKRRFTADHAPRRMVERLVAAFERWRAADGACSAAYEDRRIDVIVRTGGRPLEFLRRALASIDGQTAGRYRVILVRYTTIDLTPVTAAPWRRIEAFEVVDQIGGKRGETLAAGLSRLQSDLFAILDDDDYFLSTHIRNLLAALDRDASPRRLAYSDILTLDETMEDTAAGRLSVLREGPAVAPLGSVTNRLTSHCFLATRACAEGLSLNLAGMGTAEDALLLAAMLRRAVPLHSPGASCVYCLGATAGSDFLAAEGRARDELAFALQMVDGRGEVERRFPAQADSPAAFLAPFLDGWRRSQDAARIQARRAALGTVHRIVLDQEPEPLEARRDTAFHRLPITAGWFASGAVDEQDLPGARRLTVGAAPVFGYACQIDLQDAFPYDGPGALVVWLRADAVACAVGVAGADHQLMAEVDVPPVGGPLEVWIPLANARAARWAVVRMMSERHHGPVQIDALFVAYRFTAVAELADLGQAGAQATLRTEATGVTAGLDPAHASAAGRARLDLALSTSSSEALLINTGATPWSYVAAIPLDPAALSGDGYLEVMLVDVEEPLYVLLVDENYAPLGQRLSVGGGKRFACLWLGLSGQSRPRSLVVQSGPAPRGGRARISRVSFVAAGAEEAS